jgi:hypothetical protein
MARVLKRIGLAVLLSLGGLLTLLAVGLSVDWNPYTALAGAVGAAALIVVTLRRWAAHTLERGFSITVLGIVCVVSGIIFVVNFDGVFDSQSQRVRKIREIKKVNAEVDRKREEARAQKEHDEAEARAREERKEAAARAEREAEENRKREAAEMVELRKKDPDEYLKRLRATSDLVKWLDEMKVLRPKQYAAYQEEQKRQSQAAELERQRKSPKDYLTLDFNWSRGGFDNVMVGNFTIKSTLQFDVHDIVIACETSGASGTKLSSASQVIYDVVPAKATKRFSNVNLGFINSQSVNANCRLVSVRQ